MTRTRVDIRLCRPRPDTRSLIGGTLAHMEASRRAERLRSLARHVQRDIIVRTVERWMAQDGRRQQRDDHPVWRRQLAGLFMEREAAAS